MDKWTALVIVVSILTSSLPVLLIATFFGLVTLGTIITLVGPIIPLVVCAFVGWTIYDKVKEQNMYVAIILLTLLIIVGLWLMVTVGYQATTGGGW
jgi:hypothetical protein